MSMRRAFRGCVMGDYSKLQLVPQYAADGMECYKLIRGDFTNQYYVATDENTRRLLNYPEVVGFEVYKCLLPSTAAMMRYFREQGYITSVNILSILRGALNYPMEEACYRNQIPVHDISFLSSERVFSGDEIAGLEIKYSKLAMVPDSTLLIGDIIATGETLVHCLKYVTDHYRRHGARLRNIIIFTIGGAKGIEIMEQLTEEIRGFWPEFEGFIGVYYDGVFNTYQDRGVCGIQVPDVDFAWFDGILAPEYRAQTLSQQNPLFEKCIIYDGGARRYEIADHIKEVSEYWEGIRDRAETIDIRALMTERMGYAHPISFDDWRTKNHYREMDVVRMKRLYELEKEYVETIAESGLTMYPIARQRLKEFTLAMSGYAAAMKGMM